MPGSWEESTGLVGSPAPLLFFFEGMIGLSADRFIAGSQLRPMTLTEAGPDCVVEIQTCFATIHLESNLAYCMTSVEGYFNTYQEFMQIDRK